MKNVSTGSEVTRVLIEAADWGFSPKYKEEAEKAETEVIEESAETTEKVTEEVVEEFVEEDIHVCPLCESKLEEELSDEILSEHINEILEIAALNEAEESTDDE